MQANILPSYTPTSKISDLRHTPDLLGWIKRSDIEFFADKYILIELSELIAIDYDLSDTSDGLRC